MKQGDILTHPDGHTRIQRLAEKLQKQWMDEHNDWRTPVWGSFRDRAERILNGTETDLAADKIKDLLKGL